MKMAKPIMLALICAVLLATSYQFTKPTIAANRQDYSERILRDMVDGLSIRSVESKTLPYYEVLDDTKIAGYIFPGSTMNGYNGAIDFLVAVNPSGAVTQVRVTGHQETPGLADKIDREISPWIDGFIGADFIGVEREQQNWDLAPDGDFDGITGATITARAMVLGIKDTLNEYQP